MKNLAVILIGTLLMASCSYQWERPKLDGIEVNLDLAALRTDGFEYDTFGIRIEREQKRHLSINLTRKTDAVKMRVSVASLGTEEALIEAKRYAGLTMERPRDKGTYSGLPLGDVVYRATPARPHEVTLSAFVGNLGGGGYARGDTSARISARTTALMEGGVRCLLAAAVGRTLREAEDRTLGGRRIAGIKTAPSGVVLVPISQWAAARSATWTPDAATGIGP